MANKDQRRGNREARKPKQPKAKPQASPSSPFTQTSGKPAFSPAAKK